MKEVRQKQLIASRRNQILDAATRVFAMKGFHNATIRDVAREAGLADGTIYIYFESKSALLLDMLDRRTAAALQDVDPDGFVGMDVQDFIRDFLQRPLTVFGSDNFEFFRVIMSEIMVNPQLRERYYERVLQPTINLGVQHFEQWAKSNTIPPDRAALLMHTLSSVVIGLIVQRIMGDETLVEQWEQLPDFVSDLLFNGIQRKTQ